jgi:hypothetical protein
MKTNLAAAAGSDAVSCSCLWESCWTTPEVYSESGDELVVNTANSTSTAAELGTASSPRLITHFQQIDDMILSSAAGWLSGFAGRSADNSIHIAWHGARYMQQFVTAS